MRSLREPAEAPVLECIGRYCQLRQGERFSQPHLGFDHTGYQALALHGSAPYQIGAGRPGGKVAISRRTCAPRIGRLSTSAVNEKRCLAPAFVEPEAERLGEPIIVARHRAEHHAPVMTLWKCAIGHSR